MLRVLSQRHGAAFHLFCASTEKKKSRDCHGALKSEKIFSCLNNSGVKRHQKGEAVNNGFTVPQGGVTGLTTDLDFRTDSLPPQPPLQGLLFGGKSVSLAFP